jgi:hypothetical protein
MIGGTIQFMARMAYLLIVAHKVEHQDTKHTLRKVNATWPKKRVFAARLLHYEGPLVMWWTASCIREGGLFKDLPASFALRWRAGCDRATAK